jgi:hypothetical protein
MSTFVAIISNSDHTNTTSAGDPTIAPPAPASILDNIFWYRGTLPPKQVAQKKGNLNKTQKITLQ